MRRGYGRCSTAIRRWRDDAATRAMIESEASVVLVAELDHRIVGAVFGGILGSRATINHLAVDEALRSRALASRLVDRAYAEIRAAGVRRVFLFVADDNDLGQAFWRGRGFVPTRGETTLEIDI